jgi:hypothetical protein
METFIRLLTSKTVLGAAGGILTWLSTLPVIDVKHVLGGASALLAIAGVRDALHQVVDAVSKPKAKE